MNEEIQKLFAGGSPGDGEVRQLGVLTRHGHPLLYLPRRRVLAMRALALYPAQRRVARIARRLLQLLCSAGLAPLLPTTTVFMRADAPLSKFLATHCRSGNVPNFAILAGNPQTPGRRFILLVFDTKDRRALVVKAGVNQPAIALIEREAAVLEAFASHAAGVPRLRAVHRAEGLHALALDYADGSAPTAVADDRMAEVLGSWIDGERSLRASDVPAWQRLAQACPDNPVFQKAQARLEKTSFHPVLYHGDFAPWNVKVATDGSWQVLDWERGELTGMPCWDWFHFRVQTAILVERLPSGKLAKSVEEWLSGKSFVEYSKNAGVESIRQELLLAYLLYSIEIAKPSEGLPATRDLLNALAQRWEPA